ncbi:MAG: glycosyltransferase family 2 protein [Deltaproteobacteria bacterium]|nr:glycosyltransferase family 2 protein [Deltaproteobacteria bacterium]
MGIRPARADSNHQKKKIYKKPARQLEEHPAIEVLTLAYNSERFIDGYFSAFSRINYPFEKITIRILDNHPEHASFRLIEDRIVRPGTYPIRIVLEKSERNLGFTGGNNLLMERALNETDSPFVFLLNMDTRIDPECLSELVRFMREDNSAGMVEALQEPREHPKAYDLRTFETHWCSGGGVLIDRRALEEVGLFDDRFFLYCEDVDLSWRMWMNGWRCKINPKAKYVHLTESDDTGKDLTNQHYYSMRNCFFMHYKYDSRRGIKSLEALLRETLAKEPDPKQRAIFERAYNDARQRRLSFFMDKLKLSLLPRSQWMVFEGFSFEKRRAFIDEADRRIIL